MYEISRRKFLAGAGAAIATGALAGCAAQGKAEAVVSKPWIPEKWDYEAEIVICGYGTTGIPAALEAFDAGAKDIIVVEKCVEGGGALRRCGGGIMGAGTKLQKELGVVDSADDCYEYLVAVSDGYSDKELIRTLADNSGPNVDWLLDMGMEIPHSFSEMISFTSAAGTAGAMEGPGLAHSDVYLYLCKKYGFEPVRRVHWASPIDEYKHLGPGDFKAWMDGMPGGTGLFKPLNEEYEKRKIKAPMTETVLTELVVTPDREVLGIKAINNGKELYIKAKKAVLIGTGGWIQNIEMKRQYLPAYWNLPVGYEHKLHADGSGVIAGQAIGAGLTNMGHFFPQGAETFGGLSITTKAEVRDAFGKVIPRLYAGGVVTGGFKSVNYYSCGLDVSIGVCMGRIAGREMAALSNWV